jgi:serine/threonine-protein kinase
MIGSIVGSYKIVASLGAGGMAEVYLAEHTRIHRRAAVKVLLPEWLGTDEAADRFLSEARSTSSIRHPGIVEIYDCGVNLDGRAYIVMELLEGESLAARLARDPAFADDIARPLRVAGEVADALAAAHRAGIIHRDLKPENVFLTSVDARPSDFAVKVLDFGIAKLQPWPGGSLRESPSPSHTNPGTVLGTPAYMSPEQCSDAGRVDHRADVYSLGCILFQMLSGRPPFVGTGLDLLLAHAVQAPPLLRTLRSGVPSRVDSLVSRLLAKKPADRPASMDDVRDEIAAITSSLGVRTTRKLALDRRGQAGMRETTGQAATAAGGAWCAVRPAMTTSRLALAIGASVLVIVGSAALHRGRVHRDAAALSAAARAPAQVSRQMSMPATKAPSVVVSAQEAHSPRAEPPVAAAAIPTDVPTSVAPAEPPRIRTRRLQQAAAAAPTPRLSDDERKL